MTSESNKVRWNELYIRNQKYIKNISKKEVSFDNLFYNECFENIQTVTGCFDEDEINAKLAEIGDDKFLKIFSSLRQNLYSWIDFSEVSNVLIIGNDIIWCVNALKMNNRKVTVVSDNIYQLIILAEKYQDSLNLIYTTRLNINLPLEEEKFDVIALSDFVRLSTRQSRESVLEDMLHSLKSCVKNNGKIIFSAENAFGLKYWSGCMDTVEDGLWSSIEGYPHSREGAATYSRLKKVVDNTGFTKSEIYYPYPDCWYPMSIYSDKHLPEEGELTKNAFSWERRLHTFNEVNAWNNIISNNLFKTFSNGFLVILTDEKNNGKTEGIYTKFSNDRGDEFSIKTNLYMDENKVVHVEKKGLTPNGIKHIKNLKMSEGKLKNVFKDTDIFIQKVIKEYEDGVELEYVKGNTLSAILKHYLDDGMEDKFVDTFIRFAENLLKKAVNDFEKTEDFIKVFGDVRVPVGYRCCDITDIDLIVPNVIMRNDRYGIIDYEWTFTFPIPINYVIYRSIEYLFKGPRGESNHNTFYKTLLFDKLGIDEMQCRLYSQMEDNFQMYVLGNHIPIRKIANYTPIRGNVVQPEIYMNYGNGFNKSDKYKLSATVFDKDRYRFVIGITAGTMQVRIDPTDHPCIINLLNVYGNRRDILPVEIRTNGIELGDGVIAFFNNDPQIIVSKVVYGINEIIMELEIIEISYAIAQAMETMIRGQNADNNINKQ